MSRWVKLLQSIVRILTGKELPRAPSPSNAARIGRELGTVALTDVQPAEVLLNNCTLGWDHWDVTELAGAHLNELHISAGSADGSRSYHTLSIAQLLGGTTDDYDQHVQASTSLTLLLWCGFKVAINSRLKS